MVTFILWVWPTVSQYICASVHNSVSCGQARPVRMHKSVLYRNQKMLFSYIHSLIVPKQILTMLSVKIPLGWGTSCFKFELNLPSYH